MGAVFEYGLAGSLVWEAYAVFGIDTDYEYVRMIHRGLPVPEACRARRWNRRKAATTLP